MQLEEYVVRDGNILESELKDAHYKLVLAKYITLGQSNLEKYWNEYEYYLDIYPIIDHQHIIVFGQDLGYYKHYYEIPVGSVNTLYIIDLIETATFDELFGIRHKVKYIIKAPLELIEED